MDPQERERRLAEKAKRKPNNPTTLVVQKGTISTKSLFAHIDKNLPRILQEKAHGRKIS